MSRISLIGIKRQAAIRRRAMKRWLRAHDVYYSTWATYNETALRKLVRDNS